MKNKIVYIALSVDVLHHGHINLINHAKKYGKIIAGLITDTAISTQKKNSIVKFYPKEKNLRKY